MNHLPEPSIVQQLQYQVISTRRLQWDNLLWQVPTLSLTAQAFLFTTALGGPDKFAKLIASALSVLTSFLCITLMGRHRQAEITDSHWLENYEATYLGLGNECHGPAFQERRNGTALGVGPKWDRFIPLLPGFKTWVIGVAIFGMAGALAFMRALTA